MGCLSCGPFRAIETAIAAITRDLDSLGEIVTWANTIKSNGEKIANKTTTLRRKIEEQMGAISEHVSGLQRAEAH